MNLLPIGSMGIMMPIAGIASGGAPSYSTSASRFGGGNFYTKNNPLPATTGLTFIFAAKLAADEAMQPIYHKVGFSQRAGELAIQSGTLATNHRALIGVTRDAGLSQLSAAQYTTETADANWTSWFAFGYSISTAGGSTDLQIMMNGANVISGAPSITAGTMSFVTYAGGNMTFGNHAQYVDFSHIWWAAEYVDLSTKWNKFFDGDNKPIDLGADGSTPTGRQPEHFAPDGDLANNLGSYSNWGETGTVTAAPTSPTD